MTASPIGFVGGSITTVAIMLWLFGWAGGLLCIGVTLIVIGRKLV